MNTSTTGNRKIEIDGILIPYSWSNKNRVNEVSIQSTGEIEYVIEASNKKGRELKKLLGSRVFLKGHISPKKSVPRRLYVLSFKIIDW
jgi:hypothetical protein